MFGPLRVSVHTYTYGQDKQESSHADRVGGFYVISVLLEATGGFYRDPLVLMSRLASILDCSMCMCMYMSLASGPWLLVLGP